MNSLPAATGPVDPTTTEPSWATWAGTQRIILRGIRAKTVGHVFLRVRDGKALDARRLLLDLADRVSCAEHEKEEGDSSAPWRWQIGLSFEGLEALSLKDARLGPALLDDLARKAPAFAQGADLRSFLLGDVGDSAPERWDQSFRWRPHLVLSVYASDASGMQAAMTELSKFVDDAWAPWPGNLPGSAPQQPRPAMTSTALEEPVGPSSESDKRPGILIPLGLRDGVAQLLIQGVPPKEKRKEDEPQLRGHVEHPVGEFLLGYVNADMANVWAVPAGAKHPGEGVYKNGSFGVLRKMQLHTSEWAHYLKAAAEVHGHTQDEVAARLLGRFPNGKPLPGFKNADGTEPRHLDDFDFDADPKGLACPYGAHIRRMNPRGDPSLVSRRPRPLIRRGLPYDEGGGKVGLMGLFFCASVEEQFEHLVAQWARRDPMGSGNSGCAQDPFVSGGMDGRPFGIPEWTANQAGPTPPPLPSLTTTKGTLYLFYPSRDAIKALAEKPTTPNSGA